MTTVLIVDDDPDIRDTMSSLLEEEGHDVWTARHGRDALDHIDTRGAPDLILLDLLMPVMDGIEFITELRRRPALSCVPVVVLSASSTALPPADVPIIRKPFGLQQLLDAVAAHLP